MNEVTDLLSRPALGFTVATLGFTNTFAADSGVALEKSEIQLRVTWPISAEESGLAVFSLDRTKPLIESLGLAAKGQPSTVVMKALNPVTLLTVGSRDSKNPQGWGAFFDNTPRRPYQMFLVTLGKRRVQTTNKGTRTTISLAEASAGGFRGDVRFTFYRNSPLIHVETVMTTHEDWRAIIYDAGLASASPNWESMAYLYRAPGPTSGMKASQTPEVPRACKGCSLRFHSLKSPITDTCRALGAQTAK